MDLQDHTGEAPPPLPKRPSAAMLPEETEPRTAVPQSIPQQPSNNESHMGPSLEEDKPPLPKRQSELPIIVTPPMVAGRSSPENGVHPDQYLSPTNGGHLDRPPLSPSAVSVAGSVAGSTSGQTARSARSKEEVSFQFDRHVQEIRRRRTVLKKAPPPDRDDFTRIEAESGKRILDVRLYLQAHLMYFVESLARDDKTQRPVEPLQWKRMKALLSRLYDTSNPAQSLGMYVERVMYWRNPPETFAWFTVYFTLWFYQLWLPGFIALFAIKILNNRFGFLGNFKEVLNVPAPLGQAAKDKEPIRKASKMHSQLRDLIHSKDLTDWISQMTKIWGPYMQSLLEENICLLERFKNLARWERPNQTWRVLALLLFYITVSTFFPYMIVPAIGLFIGVEYFILLPLQKYYPRFSHVFSPMELILWGVPTNAELAVELLTKQEEDRRRRSEEEVADIGASIEPIMAAEEEIHDSESFVSALSPASKIKYEYQKRARGRSSSSASVISDVASVNSQVEKSEFHCMLRNKPGKLVITEEALLFRTAKLLGREIEAQISWDMIDTIKKSKTRNLGLWSMPGIDVTDVNGRVIVFQNVVQRDEAFRKLVVTSGKKWSNVA